MPTCSADAIQVPELEDMLCCFGTGATAHGEAGPEDAAEQVAALEQVLAAMAGRDAADASAEQAGQVC